MKVLHGISLELHAGEIVSLIGPNGAGKSTLLRSISGVCPISAGQISFKGDRIDRMKPYQIANRGLGHCPEGRAVFQHLSIEENLLAGYLDGRGKSEAELFEYVYGLFPVLADRRKSLAGRLSGGQQQMVAIARSLMGNPELLLLDEPSLGLAPIIIHQIFEIIIKLAEAGVSIVLVEQNVDLSLEIADYVYAFEHGQIHVSGPADKLSGDARVREIYLPA
ncbi:branched-chain amino acid transport system ATP-binding protein [Ochrobactrum sp. P6BSIII]|uniref:branched-chain amino acid ABC transporter ATP-binding protein n=1 Tax=unclassified Ochrobactrum TaxID=239106 RepID=UPI0009933D88|nr:branched-chain amino acid transport system ATP-binding protein [Ochrobactrum sp. P6BSIII]